jgi:hypothetical protein
MQLIYGYRHDASCLESSTKLWANTQLKPVCCSGGPCLLNVVVTFDVQQYPSRFTFPLSIQLSPQKGTYKHIAHHDWRALISIILR